MSLVEWIMKWKLLLQTNKKEMRSVVCLSSFICWHIWLARNNWFFSQDQPSPIDTTSLAVRAFNEFWNATGVPSTISLPALSMQSCPRWCPLGEGRVKLKTDASLGSEGHRSGIGFIIRSLEGQCLLAASAPIMFSSIIQGEALAIRSVLLHAIGESFDNIIVETDNQALTHCLQRTTKHPPTEIVPILEDIQHLSTYFLHVSFQFIPRSINHVADTLARKALSLEEVMLWPISTPWIVQLCNLDSMSSSSQ
ncbi:uncharacterized protein LOC122639075 [Telopea speciosissima]|uniref:uncharacterized protein LOC122639075 n=1 Tax=Telopea speciosissima TaxID=54955 RepID=UPI001CC4E986|nr:uncharacterized protein LOC122639075 [Telopea speciosissima]